MTTPAYIRIEDLPTVLRFKRGERTLRRVSELSGLSASTLSRLERGEVSSGLSLEVLHKLASYLERPILLEPSEEAGRPGA